MVLKNYYKILDLETSHVSIDEIKQAYRQAAKKYHPDLNVGDNLAEERIKDINEAYKVLSTASSKRKYDRMWNHQVGRKNKNVSYEESKRTKDSMFSDFFHMFFGTVGETKTVKSEACKGENVQTEVNISIEDAFRGKEQSIAVRTVTGELKTFKVQLPPGIQNNEKIRLIGQRKTRKKWWQEW